MNNPPIPIVPVDPDRIDEEAADTVVDGTREVDGRTALDPDAADEQIDSAEADRLASGAEPSDNA